MQKSIYNQYGNATSIVVIAIFIIAIGVFLWWQQSSPTTDTTVQEADTMMDEKMEDDGLMMENDALMKDSEAMTDDDTMMKEDSMNTDDSMQADDIMEKNDTSAMQGDSMATVGSYDTYTAEAYAAAADKKRVLFFHATWCPTCAVANLDFTNNQADIPAGVVIFKTDYDTYTELKEKYDITYQHTFVQVDAEGEVIAKWNGGGVDELVAKVQ